VKNSSFCSSTPRPVEPVLLLNAFVRPLPPSPWRSQKWRAYCDDGEHRTSDLPGRWAERARIISASGTRPCTLPSVWGAIRSVARQKLARSVPTLAQSASWDEQTRIETMQREGLTPEQIQHTDAFCTIASEMIARHDGLIIAARRYSLIQGSAYRKVKTVRYA